ncbi:AAA family ATPase [Pseudomonas aeruginosa]
MKTIIHEIGVIDHASKKHSVNFKKGLNVVTGKSSTGKSALIEIFDYCFGSSENTIPKGVITDNAEIYYVALEVNNQTMIIARRPDAHNKAFFRREEAFKPESIKLNYFESSYFRPLEDFKKHLRGFFVDIDDVDESLAARANRKYNRKSATPTIRSFTSFMLQHQNLVANKHALFYRFDEKEKRDQVIDHTKIFLGLVDQNFFLLSQEHERLTGELNRLKRQQDANKRASELYKQNVGPVLNQLYAMMGFKSEPLTV